MIAGGAKGRCAVWILAGCVCGLSLLGCDKGQLLQFYNDTGRDAVIQLGWPESEMKRAFPYKEEAELGGVFIKWPVYVYFDQETWIYDDLGGQNYTPWWWQHNDPDKYQIERNGACYFVPPELDMPVEVFPEQPEGYPKFPTRKKIEKD